MIGMRSSPQEDLQALQPAMQPTMPQNGGDMYTGYEQMGPQGGKNQPGYNTDFIIKRNAQLHPGGNPPIGQPTMPGMPSPLQGGQPMPNPMPQPQMVNPTDKGSIVKKALKKVTGGTKEATSLSPGVSNAVKGAKGGIKGVQWLMDFLNKRHEASLNHEREMLKSIIEESKNRGGGPPESMKGHEQEYYDNVRNTGNRL